MTAREDLIRSVYSKLSQNQMEELVDAFAHELAEKIRNDEGPFGKGLVVGPFWGEDRDREYAANLIDPGVEK